MVKIQEGQYYYHRHRNMWGVWKKGKDNEETHTSINDTFIIDFKTEIQAKNFVYKANGWNNKKEE